MRWEMRVLVVLSFVLATLPFSNAAHLREYSAEYDIVEQKALVTVYLKLEPASEFLWRIPSDAELIESEGAFELERRPDYVLLVFQNTTELSLSYVTSSIIEASSDNFFILDLSQVDSPKKSVLVKLPEGATLKYALDSTQPSIIPKTKDVATDGKRIIVHWDESDITQSQAVMIIYSAEKKSPTLIIALLVVIALVAIAAVAVQHYLTRTREAKASPVEPTRSSVQEEKHKRPERYDHSSLTRNLFEEEKLIVETLLKEPMHQLWQKQLELKTGLSKVKLSRKIRSLEQKGLIEKIPYGNTNKIRLKSS